MLADVLIPTIGRKSLVSAIASAAMQTYEETRIVVLSDGPVPEAHIMAHHVKLAMTPGMEDMPRIIVRATPERYGHGDHVKNHWLQNDDAAQWIKVLDDDDWLAPPCVEEMMRVADGDVAMVTCSYVVVERIDGRVTLSDMKHSRMVRGQINWSGALVNRDYCDGLALDPSKPGSDFAFLSELARRGRVVHVDTPLAWYNSWRTDAQRRESYGQRH
jgi:glycosyltransferase involved in cell wall biosynthesis